MTWILISALFACGDKNTIDTADSNTDTNTGTEDSGENQTTDTETPLSRTLEKPAMTTMGMAIQMKKIVMTRIPTHIPMP